MTLNEGRVIFPAELWRVCRIKSVDGGIEVDDDIDGGDEDLGGDEDDDFYNLILAHHTHLIVTRERK